jgi:hypothetical protein
MNATLIIKSVRGRLRNSEIKYSAVLSSGICYSGSVLICITSSSALGNNNKRMAIGAGVSSKFVGVSSL